MKQKLYETMHDYVGNAEISHYSISLVSKRPVIVREFSPAEDPEFFIEPDKRFENGGKTYVPVCWGESSESAILESSLSGTCWVRYIPALRKDTYVSDGTVYPSKKAAIEGRT